MATHYTSYPKRSGRKIDVVEHPDGRTDFGVVRLPNDDITIERAELPDGSKQFDVVLSPGGGYTTKETILPNGEHLFNTTFFPDIEMTTAESATRLNDDILADYNIFRSKNGVETIERREHRGATAYDITYIYGVETRIKRRQYHDSFGNLGEEEVGIVEFPDGSYMVREENWPNMTGANRTNIINGD